MKKRMYATVRRYEDVTNTLEAAKQVDEKFVPYISSLPGFVEYFWIDLSKGAMVSITIFKSLPDAITANEKVKAWVKENLGSVLPPAVRVEAGSIVAYKGITQAL